MRNRRELFQQAHSFVVYYGTEKNRKLSHYDIAIVEPSAHTAQEILALKAANTLVLGYVTVMELGSFHEMYHMLGEDDFLKINGETIYKEMFDTYVLDLKSKRWKGLLHHHVGKLLLHEGYDGIFLDTIGDVEGSYLPPVESNIQIHQAAEIVMGFRKWFPDHVIVQNNGLERLCSKTAPYLDGLCWENPLFSHKESQAWSQNVLLRLIQLKEQYGVRSLFLHEENEIKSSPSAGIMAQTIADKHEFLYYRAPAHYLSLSNS